jgi:3-hydroxyacyl-[acyl-carrier-protein] dehydratase
MEVSVADVIDIQRILNFLPHRYPFLLVDRIVEIEPRRRIVALKNVTFNEPFFQGHFPGLPVMPGVLVVEALAQAAAVLLLSELPDRDSKLVLFGGIDECRFRRTVAPGDQLRLEAEVIQLRSRAARMRCTARVDGEIAAEAILLSTWSDRSAL